MIRNLHIIYYNQVLAVKLTIFECVGVFVCYLVLFLIRLLDEGAGNLMELP